MNLRQFFTLLKQQRLFSGIYIICTALSTALTMTLFLVLYIMFGPVYPEQERNRMAVLKGIRCEFANGNRYSSGVSIELADSLRKMPEVAALGTIAKSKSRAVITPDGERVKCKQQMVDAEYWQVFNFHFVHGRGFSHTECEAQSPVCVITEGLARKLFGQTDVVGRTIQPEGIVLENDSLLHVVGVVRDVSSVTPMTYAQLWMANNYIPGTGNATERFSGNRTLVMLLRKGTSIGQLHKRVERMEESINQELTAFGETIQLRLDGQPDAHWKSCFRGIGSLNMEAFIRQALGLLLAFLLIPAMNMSSMVASRIDARINEMGIRRAYGATRVGLLRQVLAENFLLTLISSLLGLSLSWLFMVMGADWLPFILISGERDISMTTDVLIHADMLFSGWIMAAMMGVVLLLNLVSALAPTVWILRKHVTEELNHQQ